MNAKCLGPVKGNVVLSHRHLIAQAPSHVVVSRVPSCRRDLSQVYRFPRNWRLWNEQMNE